MSKNKKNVEKVDAEVIDIAPVIAARNAGEGPTGDSWLRDLETGTYFLVVQQNDTHPMEAVEVFLMRKAIDYAYLIFNMPDKSFPMWVHMDLYSKKYRMVETVRLPIKEPSGIDQEEEVELQ